MLLERSQLLVGLIALVVIAVGTALAVGATGGRFVRGEVMYAEFADAAGLSPGDFVFVAGFRAGQVLDVEIVDGVVRARFNLTAPEVPADSTASIILANTLGRRGISIEPGTSSDVLASDSVIPVERTRTPVDIPELGDRSAELLGEVDVDAFQALTTALADITDGTAEDVEALLEGVEAVTKIIADRRDEIAGVLDRAHVVVDATAQVDQELVAIIDDFGFVLDRLVQRRDDISRLLAETADTSEVTAALVTERRAQMDHVLASLRDDLAVIDRHQVDVAHTLAYVGVAMRGFSLIGVSGGEAEVDNPAWGNVFVTSLGGVGVGALMDCGGALDQLFTDLIGPDPRCDGSGYSGQQMQRGGQKEAEPEHPEVPPLEPDHLLDTLTRPLTRGDALGSFLRLGPTGQGDQ